jgi:hypothetical protein
VPTGRPGRSRKAGDHLCWPAWLLLAFALATIGAGIAAGHGLLIAAGLILAATAGHPCDPDRDWPRRHDAPGR